MLTSNNCIRIEDLLLQHNGPGRGTSEGDDLLQYNGPSLGYILIDDSQQEMIYPITPVIEIIPIEWPLADEVDGSEDEALKVGQVPAGNVHDED